MTPREPDRYDARIREAYEMGYRDCERHRDRNPDRALASPAAAPVTEECPEPPPGLVETLEKVHGMGCGNIATQRIPAPPSEPTADPIHEAYLAADEYGQPPSEPAAPYDKWAATRGIAAPPAPLLPRVLAALEIVDRQGTVGVTTLIRSLAAELRAYIAKAKGEGT